MTSVITTGGTEAANQVAVTTYDVSNVYYVMHFTLIDTRQSY